MAAMALLSLDAIEALAHRALTHSGASYLQAGPTARSMRDAEAEGLRNIGLAYLPTYCSHLLCGKVVGDAVPVVAEPAGAVVHVDAGLGFCHPAFEAALPSFVALARRQGIALLSMHHSYSAGVLGWMVDLLARDGLVSLAFSNSSPLVAPWGGRTAMLGTNPLAFGAPREGRPPFVVDMATSATAYVNIRQAAAEGREIPLGWAVDPDGNLTTDPNRGLAGTVAPLGGAKGFALGLIVEILAAGVTGGNWAIDSSSFVDDVGGPPDVGQVFIAIDPALGAPGATPFTSRLEAMFEALLNEEGVRLPGDRRHELREAAERDGVAVPDDLIAELEAFGS
jgi:(2R)-3-sulfolactate dehydrogenase (NADP+)